MIEKIKIEIICFIYDYICLPIYFFIVYFRDLNKIKKQYGCFECLSKADIKKYTLTYDEKARTESGMLMGEIVKIIFDLDAQPKHILLDGDPKKIVRQFKKRLKLSSAKVLTVGIGNDFDYYWDFEKNPPKRLPKKFDLIVSQAMLEHLVDPYKHITDLVNRLDSRGVLIVHTVMPGFTYHRYPIDSFRFFPDWFEICAERLHLDIMRKFQRDFNLIYAFKKRK
jgi:SAM-dependent methyltransferase